MPVLYENDVNATVCGYYGYHKAEGIQTVVGLYYPQVYAPGAGTMINGEIYKGGMNFAGEIGWLPLHPAWNEVD